MDLTESSVSAKCCHLFEIEFERTEAGKVTTATALEDRTMAFKDLMKDNISQS
jgi:hypothetical protein